MKIGWFTPFAARSIIGNYSEAAVGGLADEDDVTVFAAEPPGQGEPRPSPLPVVRVPPRLTPDWLGQLAQFDLLVYNMGNYTPYHQAVYEVALCRPGLVILHDLVLREFFRGYYLCHRNAPDEFHRLMTYSHGPEAERDVGLRERLALVRRREEAEEAAVPLARDEERRVALDLRVDPGGRRVGGDRPLADRGRLRLLPVEVGRGADLDVVAAGCQRAEVHLVRREAARRAGRALGEDRLARVVVPVDVDRDGSRLAALLAEVVPDRGRVEAEDHGPVRRDLRADMGEDVARLPGGGDRLHRRGMDLRPLTLSGGRPQGVRSRKFADLAA